MWVSTIYGGGCFPVKEVNLWSKLQTKGRGRNNLQKQKSVALPPIFCSVSVSPVCDACRHIWEHSYHINVSTLFLCSWIWIFLGWLIASLESITASVSEELPSLPSVLRAESCSTGPDMCSPFTSHHTGCRTGWNMICKSRNPPFIDWRSVFKTPWKDSPLKPADTHSVYLLIHPCVASSLFVWLKSWRRWKDLCCICFPNQTNRTMWSFSQYYNPFIVIPVKRHPRQMINQQAGFEACDCQISMVNWMPSWQHKEI